MSTNERLTVEESAALLRAIFPRYPDLDGMNPTPDVGAFLFALRSRNRERGESSPFADYPTRSQHTPPPDR
jgi:hypothetical protein